MGRMPGMMRGFFNPYAISFEIVYSVIVILLCFLVYFKTKDMYSLTKHKGIGFFRNTFLYFGLAFLFRLLFNLIHLGRFTFSFFIPMREIMPYSLVIIGYLSTMAIFSLVLSSLWKMIKWKYFRYLVHLIALAVAILVFFTRSTEILVISQLALMIYAIILSVSNFSKSKKFSHMIVIYVLLFAFWLMNLSILLPWVRLIFEFTLASYVLSIGIFLYILFRVGKWTK